MLEDLASGIRTMNGGLTQAPSCSALTLNFSLSCFTSCAGVAVSVIHNLLPNLETQFLFCYASKTRSTV